MKTIFQVFLAIVFVLLLGFLALKSLTNIEYGHHFSFENNLDQQIDSLSITIGNKTNWLYPDMDKKFEGNLDVPKKGYPHKVKIIIFSNGSSKEIPTEKFNCYNCDGSHLYNLEISGAKYKFLN